MPEVEVAEYVPSLPLALARLKAQQAIDQASTTSGVELMIDAGTTDLVGANSEKSEPEEPKSE